MCPALTAMVFWGHLNTDVLDRLWSVRVSYNCRCAESNLALSLSYFCPNPFFLPITEACSECSWGQEVLTKVRFLHGTDVIAVDGSHPVIHFVLTMYSAFTSSSSTMVCFTRLAFRYPVAGYLNT